jgi:hypothetical protein
MPTGNGDFVPRAGRLKMGERKSAHLNGVINEFVVVGGAIATKAVGFCVRSWQRGGHSPSLAQGRRGRFKNDVTGLIFAAHDRQKHAGSIKKSVTRIEMRTAHG